MTDPTRRPQNLTDAFTRLIEECAEVQQVVCKIKRFGIYDCKPGTDRMNIDHLKDEIGDLYDAVGDVFKYLPQERDH